MEPRDKALVVDISIVYRGQRQYLGKAIVSLGMIGEIPMIGEQVLPAKVYETKVQQFITAAVRASVVDFV